VVARGELAADALAVTPAGTIPLRELRAGEEVWTLDSSGRLTASRVAEVRAGAAAASLVHLFTRAGEILAPTESRLATAQGPLAAGSLRIHSDPLELLAPGDLPAPAQPPGTFEGVETSVHAVPEDVADTEALVRLLKRAKIKHSFQTAGGWLAVRLGDARAAPKWTWRDELELLLQLTVWSRDDNGETEHRTRLDQRDLRARLIAALVACEQPFELRWVPAYFPVEARISLTDTTPRPFTEVVARRELVGDTIAVEIEDAVSIVVDMAYARLQRKAES